MKMAFPFDVSRNTPNGSHTQPTKKFRTVIYD